MLVVIFDIAHRLLITVRLTTTRMCVGDRGRELWVPSFVITLAVFHEHKPNS